MGTPGNRSEDISDDIGGIQDMFENKMGSMEAAEEVMVISDEEERDEIRRRNARRNENIEGYRKVILDEGTARNI